MKNAFVTDVTRCNFARLQTNIYFLRKRYLKSLYTQKKCNQSNASLYRVVFFFIPYQKFYYYLIFSCYTVTMVTFVTHIISFRFLYISWCNIGVTWEVYIWWKKAFLNTVRIRKCYQMVLILFFEEYSLSTQLTSLSSTSVNHRYFSKNKISTKCAYG